MGDQIVSGGPKGGEQYPASCISWSCNGSSLAVGYGKTDHVSWCEHQSVVSIFSIFRRDFDPLKPTVNIDVPNCLTSLAFHPENPLILAGGTVNGEIYIWNIDVDDQKQQNAVLQKSEADEYFHREPIKGMVWMTSESPETGQEYFCLVSVSSDGKILTWKNPTKGLRYPIKGHLFLT